MRYKPKQHFIDWPFIILALCADIGVSLGRKHVLSTSGTATKADFLCELGYSLDGQPSVVCNQDGEWSNALPTCCKTIIKYFFLSIFNHYSLIFAITVKPRDIAPYKPPNSLTAIIIPCLDFCNVKFPR